MCARRAQTIQFAPGHVVCIVVVVVLVARARPLSVVGALGVPSNCSASSGSIMLFVVALGRPADWPLARSVVRSFSWPKVGRSVSHSNGGGGANRAEAGRWGENCHHLVASLPASRRRAAAPQQRKARTRGEMTTSGRGWGAPRGSGKRRRRRRAAGAQLGGTTLAGCPRPLAMIEQQIIIIVAGGGQFFSSMPQALSSAAPI